MAEIQIGSTGEVNQPQINDGSGGIRKKNRCSFPVVEFHGFFLHTFWKLDEQVFAKQVDLSHCDFGDLQMQYTALESGLKMLLVCFPIYFDIL